MNKKENIIISLGGSLVVPEEIDIMFLDKFKKCLKKNFKRRRFFILVGGGRVCRVYQRALLDFGAKNNDADWLGIDISRLNAKIVKQLFGKKAFKDTIVNPTKKLKINKDIIIGGGYKPGWSTDYVSVLIAKTYKVKTVINLSNIDYVYNKDPKKFTDAKPLKKVDWKDFVKIVGNKWTPGLNMPFDPRASKLAKKLKLRIVVMNGKKLNNLDNFLNDKLFEGTIIQ